MNSLFLVLALVSVDPTVESPKLTEVEQTMLVSVNKERARYNLPPVEIDMTLQVATRSHAHLMASKRSMWHPAGCGIENVAQGQSDCHSAIRTWMNSSGHRANILRHNVTRLGISGYVDSYGRHYWCMRVR